MKTPELLSELGAHIGLSNVSFNDEGVCRLVFGDRAYVDLERGPDDHTLYLHTVVGQPPAEGKQELYVQLLSGNFFGLLTGGNVLALEPGSSDICLCRTLAADGLNAETFAELLLAFVEAAEKWSEIVSNSEFEQAADGGLELQADMMRV